MLNEKDLIKEYSKYYNYIGNYSPYTLNGNKEELFLEIGSALSNTIAPKLDVVGIIEILNKSYLFSDRTLVKGIKRVDWMVPYEELSKEELHNYYSQIPQHKKRLMKPEEIAVKLKKALKKELEIYLQGKKKVAILLSGGLDSRIVAGLLKELQVEKKYNGEVCAATWGIEKSRDVIYARNICNKYDWEFIYVQLDATVLKQNIYLAGKMGAEFSPIHLHAMNKVKDIENIDAIIAGSYGDVIGRGDYASIPVANLPEFLNRKLNPYGILKQKVVKEYKASVLEDAYGYREHIKRDEEYQYREIEQEIHFMRRKLQACMNVMGAKVPLYQLFTSPEVVSLMWSLDPKIRDAEIYKYLISTLPGGIDTIPWARDGKPITGKDEEEILEKGTKEHHSYGMWLREDLYEEIYDFVFSSHIENLGIFNMKTLESLFIPWKASKTMQLGKLDEVFAWLASLSVFISEYNIVNGDKFKHSKIDDFNAVKGALKANMYFKLRDMLRG